MKRVGGLFDAVWDRRTLAWAAWRAARGKRLRKEVRDFLADLEGHTARLSRDLREGRHEFGDYRAFSIRDPKCRIIHAPPFRDRVVHHAMMLVAGPALERGAFDHSYACRAGRGQHAALRAAWRWTRAGDWFLKLDVRKFYDSVDHDLVRTLLGRRFRERRLLRLFDALMASYQTAPGKGLPIGALTSQYLGNFFLDPFDRWVKQARGIRRYMRYMDDMVLWGGRDILLEALREVPARLGEQRLELKHGGELNRCDLGVPLLGFVLYPDRIRLNRAGRRRLRRRVGDLERSFRRGLLPESELQARGAALFAHARFASDAAWRRAFLRLSDFGETLEPAPRPAGRLLEQRRQELPLRDPQQEQAR